VSRSRLVVSFTFASLLASAAVAPAQTSGDRATLKLTSKRPATATGLSLTATFAPERIIDQITIVLPSGMRIDPRAVPSCRATLAEIQAAGSAAAACPANTRIGTGNATAVLGQGAPTRFQLVIFNRRGGQEIDINLNGQTAFGAFGEIRGRRIVIPLGQTPQLNARITRFAVTYRRAGTRTRPYLRTPRRCPSSGRLRGAVEARAAGATATAAMTATCTRARG
jgi:hypothetical protein